MDESLVLKERYRIAAIKESLKRRGYYTAKQRVIQWSKEWTQAVSEKKKAKEDWEKYKEKRERIKEEKKNE